MPKFCPRCGKEDVDFYEGFCIDCYLEMHSFTKFPKKLVITKCKRCGSWLYRGHWIEDSFKNLSRIVKKQIRTDLFSPKFEVDMQDDTVSVKIKGYLDGRKNFPVEKKNDIKLEFEARTCENCMKMSGSYYEFIIQLRRKRIFDAKRYAKVVGFIKKETHHLRTEQPEAKMFWVEKTKDGLNFFFGSKHVGKKVLNRTMSKFRVKSEMSTTFKGFTKRGKKKIKFTYCIRV